MSDLLLDLDDPAVMRAFDQRLALARAGALPAGDGGSINTPEDYTLVRGEAEARRRNPTPDEKVLAALVDACTVTDDGRGWAKVSPPPDLPPGVDPALIERATQIRFASEMLRALEGADRSQGDKP